MQGNLSDTNPTDTELDNLIDRIKVLNIENKMPPLTLAIDPLKYLGKLPEFHGDYRELQNFSDLIERIHPLLITYDDISQRIFSDIIKSKLKGRAREVIEINNHVTPWKDIKDVLNKNFGDRMTASQLFDELRGLTFKHNAVEFYNEMKTVLHRLNIKTKLEYENNVEILTQTLKANISSALNIFKAKIPEPMKSILYCRNPADLEEAINILHEAGYAYLSVNTTGRSFNNDRHNNNSNREGISRGRNNGRYQDRNSFSSNPQIRNPHINPSPRFNTNSQPTNLYRNYGPAPIQNSRNYIPTTVFSNHTFNRNPNLPSTNTNSRYRNSPNNNNNNNDHSHRANNFNNFYNNNSRNISHPSPSNNSYLQVKPTPKARINSNNSCKPMDVDINTQNAVHVGNFRQQSPTNCPT